MSRRRIDGLAILGLCLIPLFYFAPVLFYNQTFYFHDISINYVPLNVFNTRTIWQGELPLWNPYLNGGFPFAAESETSGLYLLNLILFLPLPITTTHAWYFVAHYMLAGVFTYLLVRFGLRLRAIPALMAGLSFTYSGLMISQLTNFTLVSTLTWLPLILLLYIRALDESKVIYTIGAGVVMTVQISKSHPQIVLYTAGILALYALLAMAIDFRAGKGIRSLIPLRELAIILVVSAGLSAYQLFYTFELIQRSNRAGGITYDVMTVLSYPPPYLITFLVPNFFGTFQHYAGLGNFPEMHTYVGVLPLILTVFAWLKPKHWRVWFFTALMIICIVLSFGRFTPLYNLLQYLPVFNYFRAPARWLLLVTFCLAILAAYGVQALVDKKWPTLARPRQRTGVIVFAVLLGLVIMSGGAVLGYLTGGPDVCAEQNCLTCTWRPHCIFNNPQIYFKYSALMAHDPGQRDYFVVERIPANTVEVEQQREQEAFRQRVLLAYIDMVQSLFLFLFVLSLGLLVVFLGWQGWINPRLFGLLATLVLLLDLLTYGGRSINPTTTATYFLEAPDTVQFLKQIESSELYRIFPTITWIPYPHNVDYVLSTLHYNLPALYEIESIEGGATLPLNRHTRYMRRAVGRSGGLQMLGIANVKYIITEWDLEDNPDLELVFEGKAQKIYRNLRVLPRSFVVYQAEVLQDEVAILDRLADPSFDPLNVIILEEQPDPVLPATPPAVSSTAQVVTHKHHRVVIDVNMADTGFVFLSDAYYPGWNVYVDGQRSHVYRANYLFRAVEVSAGRHAIEFRYEPRSFRIGLGITLLSVILVAAWAWKSQTK